MRINTNVTSLKTRYYLGTTNQSMEKIMERLSSGKRINTAGDDAAGMAISSRMTNQIRGMEVATRNSLDGVSLVQTAETALGSLVGILQRMRELSVQADNGTYSLADKDSLQQEFDELLQEIDHMATNASFNGINLLDGSEAAITLHISDKATDTMSVTLQDARVTSLGLDNLSITNAAQSAITTLDIAIDDLNNKRALLGSFMQRLNFTIDSLNVMGNNLSAARSRIEDADMAKEMSDLTKSKILAQSSMSMLVHANQNPQMILQLLQG